MSDDPRLSIGFAGAAGTAENRWIRLEQVGQADQAITYAEAADLVDSLYNTSPCDNDGNAGTGGEAADEAALPDEADFLAGATARLGIASCNEDCAAWPVEVDVLRSHQDGAWNLVSETAEIGASVTMTGRKHETVELAGAVSHDLEYPFSGDLLVAGAQVASVRGSTVNFTRPVNGWVRLSYTAIWDRVTVRVPVAPNSEGVHRAQDAALLCFWQRLAAALTLRQPEDDADLDALRQVCPRYRISPRTGDCQETVEHYTRCRCSGAEAAGGWEETVRAPCPDGKSAGSWVGHRREFGGYVGCPGERDEQLSDPEYYKSVCCHYPPAGKSLPVCRTIYSTYRGGAAIEGGAQHWRETYGADVRLTAVTPEGGCGEQVLTWNVERQNCCDDVIPLEPSPDNPTTIRPGGQYIIGAQDGTGRPGSLTWQLSGGLEFPDGSTYTAYGGRLEAVRARADICPQPMARLDDGCYPLELVFDGDGASTPVLSAHDLEVGAGHSFVLSVSGGVPPYMWMATGDVDMIAISADGTAAQFRTRRRNEWCYGEVTVSDTCGNDDRCGVRNALTGQWEQHKVPSSSHEYYYNPPGSPYPMPSDFSPANGAAQGMTEVRGKYKVSYYTRLVQRSSTSTLPPEVCSMFTGTQAMYSALCATISGAYMEGGVCYKKIGVVYTHQQTCYALSWYEWLCHE